MLSSKPRLLRSVASLLLVQTVSQLAWPTVSYALTAGPTAPEATSFEPVDTTDMVNLLSGDLTYNIPLLEVPGPEGGYPLSLAYHAGIQPDEESSWVGLGWSLNPGAINRNVNGYADDQKEASQTVRDYWVGGVRQTYKIGVGAGIAGSPASISAGLSFSNDTYRGFAVGEYIGVGARLGQNSTGSIGVSAVLSTDGYGNANAGVSIGVASNGAISAGASVGLNTNFSSVSANAGAGLSVNTSNEKGHGKSSNSLMGASISTDGGKVSLKGPGGSSGITNYTAGRIQTQSNGFALDIPVPGTPAFVSLGYDYTRYWSDETNEASVSGALYYPKAYNSQLNLDNYAYDTYRINDPEHENLVDNPDPNWVRGGSLPDYDDYNVVAQGLGGTIRPYSFQEALYSRSTKALDDDGDPYYRVKEMPLAWTNKPVSFRFDGDFSNSYRQENMPVTGMAYSFGTPTYGDADGNYGYNPSNDQLAGSKHIEYYTNAQILDPNGHPGFVGPHAKGFNRNDTTHPELSSQIGGFKITNASGVTYHFSLPVYAYEEYSRSESLDDPNTFNELKKYEYYAYNWLLTAITGPDYVDRNTPGLDASDWGYWVEFKYGMWSDHYRWRNPAVGYRSDVDSKVRTFSRGRKQVYYLNSIVTRTHTAIFEKELRNDAKGTSQRGFLPSDSTSVYIRGISSNSPHGGPYYNKITTNTHEIPANSLRLKSIILLNNADVPVSLENNSSTYDVANDHVAIVSPDGGELTNNDILRAQYGSNVIDSNDLDVLNYNLKDKAIRVIKFAHDYSLANGTLNSLNSNGDKLGKLCLKSIDFLGSKGISVLPPTKFNYELTAKSKQSYITPIYANASNRTIFVNKVGIFEVSPDAANTNNYEAGDIITLPSVLNDPSLDNYYVVLDQISGASPARYHVRCLRDGDSYISAFRYFSKATKNPPYQAENTDWWGMYKSDFDATLIGLAGGIARRTTAVSNKAVDVWSLRTITSPTGSKVSIEYEGDQYSKPVLDRPDMVCRVGWASYIYNNGGHPQSEKPFELKGLNLAQAKALTIPGNNILLNGLKGVVNGSNLYYENAFNVPAHIESIEAQPNYTTNAVMWVSFPKGYTSFYSQGIYMSLPKVNTLNEGGGLRVKSVAVSSNNTIHTTAYNYNKAFSAQGKKFYLPSGVTTYEPGNIVRIDKDEIVSGSSSGYPTANEVRNYKQAYTAYLVNLFAIARQLPAPGVMYEAVTTKETITKADGTQIEAPNSWTYRFAVFKENMIGHTVALSNQSNRLYTSLVSIKDYTSRIGSLLSATHYGENGRKLSETVNHFLHDDLNDASYAANSDPGSTGYQAKLAQFKHQGVIQESFADSRDCLSAGDGNFDHLVVMTKHDVYPTIQTSTTTTDYTTGLATTSETLGFDFYSGTATRTASTDGYGNRTLTQVVPAYRQYPAMGLKVNGTGNKHMLSQTASTTTYKVDANNNPLSVLAASAQTWSDQVPVVGLTDNDPEKIALQAGIWRPWQTYNWLPTGTTTDGLTPLTGNNKFVGYDYNSPTQNLSWKRTSEVTLYNAYSNALEAKDINGTYLATKLGFNQSKILVTGGPAAYQELVYSGAEETSKVGGDYFSGAVAVTWAPGSGTNPGGPWGSGNVDIDTDPTHAHTGNASLRLGSYKHGFSYLLNADASVPGQFHVDPDKAYRVSVWTNNPMGQMAYWVDNQEKAITSGSVQKRTADGWYLLELTIQPIGKYHSTLRVGCYNSNGATSVLFDDFRFQPLNAQVTSYVYDQLTGQVTYILDNNNLYTRYEYAADGRLKRVSRETFAYGGKRVAEHSYHIAGALTAASLETTYSSVIVNVPEAAEPVTISYDNDGTGYKPLSTAAKPYTFGAVYGQWVKVRITDSQGNVRELVKHLL